MQRFVFFAIAIRQTGALLKTFSGMNWICQAGMIKLFARASLQLNSTAVYASLFFCLGDNHLLQQYDECKVSNQQFQDYDWVKSNHVKIRLDSD